MATSLGEGLLSIQNCVKVNRKPTILPFFKDHGNPEKIKKKASVESHDHLHFEETWHFKNNKDGKTIKIDLHLLISAILDRYIRMEPLGVKGFPSFWIMDCGWGHNKDSCSSVTTGLGEIGRWSHNSVFCN